MKEFSPNVDRMLVPIDPIREVADDSLSAGPFRHRTDQNGFIHNGNSLQESPSNLLILGDSFVESIYADETQRFASQVERNLHDSRMPFNVLNGGYSGMTSLQMLTVLATKAPSYMTPGSKLMVVIGQSDANALLVPGMYWGKTRSVSPFMPIEKATGAPARDWRETLGGMVTCVVQVAKALSIDVLLSAGLFRNGDFETDQVLRRAHKENKQVYERRTEIRHEIIDVVQAVASENQVACFDASATFLKRPELFYDLLHLNPAGQDLYASMLSDWLKGQI